MISKVASLSLAALAAVLIGAAAAPGSSEPTTRAASTCAHYATQAEAQRAADTRDADSDGIYCVISPR